MNSVITVKGQATIPKAIREYLRLKPGDRVKFLLHPAAAWFSCQSVPPRRCAASSSPDAAVR